MEDWLYDEGEDQPKKVYVEQLTELKKRGDPVVERQGETLQRPAAFEELGKALIHYEKILSAYDDGVSGIVTAVHKCFDLAFEITLHYQSKRIEHLEKQAIFEKN